MPVWLDRVLVVAAAVGAVLLLWAPWRRRGAACGGCGGGGSGGAPVAPAQRR